MAVIGIDLGTTNSLASVWKDGKSVLIPNSFNEYLSPSAVGFDDDGELLIGKIAKERLIGITSGLLVTIEGSVYSLSFLSSSSSSIKLFLLIIVTLYSLLYYSFRIIKSYKI